MDESPPTGCYRVRAPLHPASSLTSTMGVLASSADKKAGILLKVKTE